MNRRLPPLNALRAFESAARHLSFKNAAAELNVTPGAISHHVKVLEEQLGVPLFLRLTRSLRLTEAGQSALPLLAQGFDKLAQGVDEIRKHNNFSSITVSVSPSFGAKWLVPRLERFRSLYPDIEVRIDGTDTRVNLAAGEADLAIRFGPGGYGGVCSDHLFSPINTPVCSPELMTGEYGLKNPKNLRHHTLLHIDWKDDEASWRMWLLAAGYKDVDPTRGPHYTMESMAILAAIEAQGIALVGDILVADDIATGRLVHPFDSALNTSLSFSYYLLSPVSLAETSKVSAFRHWLLQEAADWRSSSRTC
ncbi:MAG: transcriptional regulator GcvA [Pseudomonadota bacterium]